MGIGMMYTRHGSPADMAKRGLKLFLIGYALNLYRAALPALGMTIIGATKDAGPFFIMYMFCVDIMQFAGLTFLTIALMKKLKMKNWMMFLVAVALLLLSTLMPVISEEKHPIASYLFGVIVYQNENTAFPWMQWLFFPTAGMLFGEMLRNAKNKNRLYGLTALAGLLFFAVCTGLAIALKRDISAFFTTNYYNMDILQAVWTLGVDLLWLPLLYLCSLAVREGIFKNFVSFCSKHINNIYIAHWCILIIFFMINYLVVIDSLWKVILEAILALALSVWFARLRDNKRCVTGS